MREQCLVRLVRKRHKRGWCVVRKRGRRDVGQEVSREPVLVEMLWRRGTLAHWRTGSETQSHSHRLLRLIPGNPDPNTQDPSSPIPNIPITNTVTPGADLDIHREDG